MKLAIMQPYFFPYIGYWQLLNVVDRFVIYDDVNFIKGGWINRNRILINSKTSYITAPLHQASPNKRICDISLQPSPVWRRKMIKSIENTYRKSPFFTEVFPIVSKIICYKADNLTDYLTYNIGSMATFMGIKTELVTTSRCYQNSKLTGEDRVLDICEREGANTYINLQGGQTLYDAETFHSVGIDLRFIVIQPIKYKQRTDGFVPYLSIIDALMEIGTVDIVHHMNKFELYRGFAPVTLKQ